VKAGSEPLRQLFCGDDPLTGINSITDTVDPAIRCAEIRIAAKGSKTKKTGASADANAPVID